ncbi:MAG: hypothetical protein WDO16_08920 [Bacteroidota bacterium]
MLVGLGQYDYFVSIWIRISSAGSGAGGCQYYIGGINKSGRKTSRSSINDLADSIRNSAGGCIG